MKYKLTFLLVLLFAVLCFAQTRGKIKGVVKNDGGDPISGAFVLIEGTHMGTQTDENGYYYIIGALTGTYNLKCEFVGYRTSEKKEVNIKTKLTTTVDFILNIDSLILLQNKNKQLKKTKSDAPQTRVASHKVNLSHGKAFEIFPRNIIAYPTKDNIPDMIESWHLVNTTGDSFLDDRPKCIVYRGNQIILKCNRINGLEKMEYIYNLYIKNGKK